MAQASSPDHQQSSMTFPLFELPPELQNEIFRLALVEGNVIDISNGVTEPGLLATCRQIWSRAKGYYHLDNCFEFKSGDYETTKVAHLARLQDSQRLGKREMEVKKTILWKGNWEDLSVWL